MVLEYMKRGIIAFVLILSVISFTSAGIFDWFKDPQLAPQNFSVTVGNAVPVVDIVDNPGSIALNPSSTRPVSINFTAQDNNGISDLNDATVSISFDYSGGGEQRTGGIADCSTSDIDSYTREYICFIDMEFYDIAGIWDITVSIDDLAGPLTGTNNTESFTVGELKFISLTPPTISFGVVSPGQTNIAGGDTTVTNDGNYDIQSNDLLIVSRALIGQTIATQNISGDDFASADQSEGDVCGSGTSLDENDQIPIPNFILSKGAAATRDVQHCLTSVPLGISDQVYSTEDYPAWEFNIV